MAIQLNVMEFCDDPGFFRKLGRKGIRTRETQNNKDFWQNLQIFTVFMVKSIILSHDTR